MLKNGKRTFIDLQEYFDYLTNELGHPNIHHHFTEDVLISDGIEIHLDIYDYDKHAPTIVFIPGTALYSLCYAEMLFELGKRGYNMIGFDPRGHGRSGGTRGDFTIEDLMINTESVISYAIKRYNPEVSLLGSSQGGIVALYVAAKDNRLKSVICHCTADLSAKETLQLVKYPNIFRLLKPLVKRIGSFFPNTQVPIMKYIDLEHIKVKYFGTIKQFMEIDPLVSKTISIRALKSLSECPPPRPIEEIEVPVMILSGSEDRVFPIKYTKGIYNRLTCNKHLEIYDGLDHALLHEDVEVILPPILKWLSKIHNCEKALK